MTAPTTTPPTAPSLRMVVVPTPQPPLVDQQGPLRLVVPGVRPPRPVHRPGPRPRPVGVRPDADFGPTWWGGGARPPGRPPGGRLRVRALELG
ncbi:hypothetical protein ACI797_17665, partial [Geodermatophilus sp. SYSU D00691]